MKKDVFMPLMVAACFLLYFPLFNFITFLCEWVGLEDGLGCGIISFFGTCAILICAIISVDNYFDSLNVPVSLKPKEIGFTQSEIEELRNIIERKREHELIACENNTDYPQ